MYHMAGTLDARRCWVGQHAGRRSSQPRRAWVQQRAQKAAVPRAAAAPDQAAQKQTVTVVFKAAGGTVVEAQPGENILEVARRSGVVINVGCCSNSCGICEVEVIKVDAEGNAAAPAVARSCVAGIPPGYARIEIDDITDAIWGVDGYDT